MPGGRSGVGELIARSDPRPHRYQSVLFWVGWDGGKLSTIPWSAVTQVDLFSLSHVREGKGRPAADCTGPRSLSTKFNGLYRRPSGFVSMVHRHHKLALDLGGRLGQPGLVLTPCNPSNVAAFARNLVRYMRSNGFDGIDLDISRTQGRARHGSPQPTSELARGPATATRRRSRPAGAPFPDHLRRRSDDGLRHRADPEAVRRPVQRDELRRERRRIGRPDRRAREESRIPAAKITAGLDIGDYPRPSRTAGTAGYAATHRLAGAMLWFGQADAPSYSCLQAIARYVP